MRYTVVICDQKKVIESYEAFPNDYSGSYRHVYWLTPPYFLMKLRWRSMQCKRFPGQDMPLNVLVGVEVGMSVKVSCSFCPWVCGQNRPLVYTPKWRTKPTKKTFSRRDTRWVRICRYGWDGTGFNGMGLALDVMWCDSLQCHVISCDAMRCDVRQCDVMYTMSFDVM